MEGYRRWIGSDDTTPVLGWAKRRGLGLSCEIGG
jgi:hypothetical protein